ncbi:MAG TPA: aminoglycoside phosphotransferase family protein [Ktedonobacteraceae bacterium]|nr:aminoglycoside phosphotransferase family protein [Ktedonobacteraceae bacterium]
MNAPSANAGVSILDLPGILTLLFERAGRPLLPGAAQTPGLFVRYLRRKPARGLAVIYAVDEVGKRPSEHARDPHRSVSLTLDEQALDGAAIQFSEAQAHEAALEVQPSGVLRVDAIGLSVQAFPADSGLPALAASCDISSSQVFQAIEQAARAHLQDEAWSLKEVVAEPVRYKPGNRCVIRYRLTVAHNQHEEQRHLTIFGKVYADPRQARSVQALQQRLYDEQVTKLGGSLIGLAYSTPLLPRPLGIVDEIGLTFNEAVQPASADEHMLTGTRALQPRLERGPGGAISSIALPVEELRLTAAALARLHSSAVRPAEGSPRTGAKEAKRARDRAALIASRNAAQAEEVQRLAQDLAARLETIQPDSYRPAHGGFKSSQLLFHSHQVFVVDFDGFCMADAALDVGYFLAYLRPSGLWYHNPGMREWFEGAAQIFTSTYRQAMLEAGATPASIDGILERSRLYEAALIFKIATRRANRLNSPRPKELSSMLDEIAACLLEE